MAFGGADGPRSAVPVSRTDRISNSCSKRKSSMTSVDFPAGERPTFTKHLECSLTGDSYPADKVHTLSRAGKPLLVRYDLEALRRAVTRESLPPRASSLCPYLA